VQFRARDNVPVLAGVLSAVSLALVFAAALRVVPGEVLPRSEPLVALVPHLNAVISVVAVGTIAAGVAFVRRGRYREHRAAMAASFGLFVVFLALYLYRVSVHGPTTFPASGPVATAYYGLLAVHILLAVVCVPLVYYVLLLAATRPVAEVFGTRHARVGRVAASLWLVSFVLGIAVYLLLYVVY